MTDRRDFATFTYVKAGRPLTPPAPTAEETNLARRVRELTWPDVVLIFDRDSKTGEVRVSAGCERCDRGFFGSQTSYTDPPTLTISAAVWDEAQLAAGPKVLRWLVDKPQPTNDERGREMDVIASTIADRVNRMACSCKTAPRRDEWSWFVHIWAVLGWHVAAGTLDRMRPGWMPGEIDPGRPLVVRPLHEGEKW